MQPTTSSRNRASEQKRIGHCATKRYWAEVKIERTRKVQYIKNCSKKGRLERLVDIGSQDMPCQKASWTRLLAMAAIEQLCVIPAQAGIHSALANGDAEWIPACAGMTNI
jgi:hypothetical protein